MEQNLLRPIWNQIPESIIKKSYDKIEGNFINCMTLKSRTNKDSENMIIGLLDFLKNPVIIQNEISLMAPEEQKNFFHLMDISCREKIGFFNQNYLANKDDGFAQKANKTMANFKKFYQNFVKFCSSQKDLKNFEEIRKQQINIFEKISIDFSKIIDFKNLELKILEMLEEMELQSILNDDKIKSQAKYFSNYFFEILEQLFA